MNRVVVVLLHFFVAFPLLADEPDSVKDDNYFRELCKTASLWQVGENRDTVDWAREKLIGEGEAVVDYIMFDKIGSESALESRATEAIFKGTEDIAVPKLIECLADTFEEIGTKANIIYHLGKLKAIEALDTLYRFLTDTSDTIQRKLIRITLYALGEIGDTSSTEKIVPFLGYGKERVRTTSVEALGKIKDIRCIRQLVSAFDDDVFSVRYGASLAISRFEPYVIDSLLAFLLEDGRTDRMIAQIIYTVGLAYREAKKDTNFNPILSGERIFEVVSPFAGSSSRVVRARTVETLLSLEIEDIEDRVFSLFRNESDPYILKLVSKER